MSTNDLYQAREWPAGTADKMNEWAESQLGFSLEPWQMDWLRQMEAPLPDPPLPDPLFGARATHPYEGEGIVASHYPDVDGYVRFMFPNEAMDDGTRSRWVDLSALTFHTSDHPEFLETEEDYANAPEGTIVAGDEGKPFVLIYELWRNPNPWRGDHSEMAGIRRRVLRGGVGKHDRRC